MKAVQWILGIAPALALCCAAIATESCGGEPAGSTEIELRCESLCENYRVCGDSGFDFVHCAGRCTSRAAGDTVMTEQIGNCDRCLLTLSCGGAGDFPCAAHCDGILP